MLEPGTPTVDQTTGRKTPVREIATTATTTTTVAASPPTPGSVAIAIGSTPAEPVSFNRRPSVVLAMQAASLPVDVMLGNNDHQITKTRKKIFFQMDSPQQDHRQLQLTRVRPFKGTPSNEDLGPSLLSTKEEFPLVSPTSSDHPFGTSASRPIPVMTTRSRGMWLRGEAGGQKRIFFFF